MASGKDIERMLRERTKPPEGRDSSVLPLKPKQEQPSVKALRERLTRIGGDIADFSQAKAQLEELLNTIEGNAAATEQFHQLYNEINRKLIQIIDLADQLRKTDPRLLEELEKILERVNRLSTPTLIGGGGGGLTGGEAADNVWDELIIGHAIAGSTAAALSAVLADTNELQTDWHDGGRLDLIIDSIITYLVAIPTAPTLQATWTDAKAGYLTGAVALEASVQTVDGVVDAIKAETDQLSNWRFHDHFASTPTVDNVASANETALTAGTFTITYPTGATKVKAIVYAYLHAAAQAAGGHKIGLTLQYSRDGGAYADVVDLTATTPLAIPDLDEAMATFAIEVDVSTVVTTSAVVYGWKWLVDSDNAGSVNYTSNFGILMIYSM